MHAPRTFPSLREDLQVSQLDPETYQLVDPQTGRSLQLDSTGFLIAEQFETGDRSLRQIQDQLQAQHGIRISVEELEDFLRKVNRLGFLAETPGTGADLSNGGLDDDREIFVPGRRVPDTAELATIRKRVSGPFGWLYTMTPGRRYSLLLIIVIFFFPWKLRITGPLRIIADEQFSVRASSEGIVEEIFVHEGDPVTAGTALVRLAGYGPEIRKKQSELEKLEAELRRLKAGATSEEINQIAKTLEVARGVALQAQTRADRAVELHRKGLISAQEMDQAVSEKEISLKRREEAEAQLALVKSGTRKEVVGAKEAELKAVRGELSYLTELQEKSMIRSPIQGVVSSPDTQTLRGRRLLPGDLVLEIADPDRLSVEMRIAEEEFGQIRLGKPILFKVQAFPSLTFHAKTTRIAPMASTASSDPSAGPVKSHFRVYGEPNEKPIRLRPGMTGLGQIDGEGILGTWTFLGARFFRGILRSFRVQYVL